MILKSMLLAVVIFLGSLTLAEAQSFSNSGVILGWGTEGWSFNNVSSCLTFTDAANTGYYAFFVNNSGHIFTINPAFAPIIASACASGNSLGINIIAFTPQLLWNGVATFPSK